MNLNCFKYEGLSYFAKSSKVVGLYPKGSSKTVTNI